MRRRDILMLLGVVSITPLGAAAQSRSGKTWRIAYFYAFARVEHVVSAFVQGMRQLGHTEGQDFIIDYFVYDADKPDEAAREIVQHHVDLILVTTQSDIVLAAKRATRDIPIVFVVPVDPVANGIVASMSRPGGNATGLTSLNTSADAKRLELLKEAMPGLRRVALLASRGDPATSSIASAVLNAARALGVELKAAAQALGLQIVVANVDRPEEIEAALQTLANEKVDIAIVVQTNMFFLNRSPIAASTLRKRLPTVYGYREHVGDGGLVSYGVDVRWCYRRAAYFAAKILHGAAPSDLPLEFPTSMWLAANQQTANALGITIPPNLLGRADEVIE